MNAGATTPLVSSSVDATIAFELGWVITDLVTVRPSRAEPNAVELPLPIASRIRTSRVAVLLRALPVEPAVTASVIAALAPGASGPTGDIERRLLVALSTPGETVRGAYRVGRALNTLAHEAEQSLNAFRDPRARRLYDALEELSAVLPPNATRLVVASLRRWATVTPALTFDGSSVLPRQRDLWRALLVGDVRAIDFLGAQGSVHAAGRLASAATSRISTIPGFFSAAGEAIEERLWTDEVIALAVDAITLLPATAIPQRNQPETPSIDAGPGTDLASTASGVDQPAAPTPVERAAARRRVGTLWAIVVMTSLRLTALVFARAATVGGILSDRLEALRVEEAVPAAWPQLTGPDIREPAAPSDTDTDTDALARASVWAEELAKADALTQARFALAGVVTSYGLARIRGELRLAVIRYLPANVSPTHDLVEPVPVGYQTFPVVLRRWRASGQGPPAPKSGSCWVTFASDAGSRLGFVTARHAVDPPDATPGDLVKIDTLRNDPPGRLHAISDKLDVALVDISENPGDREPWRVSDVAGFKPVRLLGARRSIDTDVVEFFAPGATIPGEVGKEPVVAAMVLLGKRLQRGDSGCLGLDLEPTRYGAEPAPYLIYLGRMNLKRGGDQGYGILLEQVRRTWSLTVTAPPANSPEKEPK